MSKPTPGPWKTGREDMQSYDGNTTKPFTNIYHDTMKDGFHMGQPLPLVIGRAEGANNKANARLIAAAPRMLEALKDARMAICSEYCSNNNNHCLRCVAIQELVNEIEGASK